MPDEATVRDVAQKLERWAVTLRDDERVVVQGWMGLGRRGGWSPGTVWWFEPSSYADRPSAQEAG